MPLLMRGASARAVPMRLFEDLPATGCSESQELHYAMAGGVAGISVCELGDRRAEMRFRGVLKRADQRVPLERLLNGGALHAFAASMNQADFAQAAFMRGPDVLLDDRHHVARVKGVKVDGRFDGNAMRLIHDGGGPVRPVGTIRRTTP